MAVKKIQEETLLFIASYSNTEEQKKRKLKLDLLYTILNSIAESFFSTPKLDFYKN